MGRMRWVLLAEIGGEVTVAVASYEEWSTLAARGGELKILERSVMEKVGRRRGRTVGGSLILRLLVHRLGQHSVSHSFGFVLRIVEEAERMTES